MKLSSAGLTAEEMRAALTARRPSVGAYINNMNAAQEIFSWLHQWHVNAPNSSPTINCNGPGENIGRKPATMRQEFYQVRETVRSNTEITEALREQYGEPLFSELCERLRDTTVSMDEHFIYVSRVNATGGGLMRATSWRAPESVVFTLRSRFDDWLAGDMLEPFMATNEQITLLDQEHFKMKAAELREVVRITVTQQTLLASKI